MVDFIESLLMYTSEETGVVMKIRFKDNRGCYKLKGEFSKEILKKMVQIIEIIHNLK